MKTIGRVVALTVAVGAGYACTPSQKRAEEKKAEPAVEQTAAVEEAAGPKVTEVTDARLKAADKENENWLSYGRTYKEQRFSPLKKVNRENVAKLGLGFYYDIEVERGMEATPIVVDGRMYTTSAWSKVFALDAKTGEELWTYDPEVPKKFGKNACCDVVNRGVAVYGGNVYVATIDGRLVALNADNGTKVWETLTVDQNWPYTITGAPRIANGKVLIGNGGAELGVRGYVTAYDAKTGKQVWRFYTVPGNPADGFENKAMEMAAKTWKGEWWKYGGGGTAWDSIVFDPELNSVYIGVGNGSPWNQNIRSPGGGDNLFLSSIVAVDADTGEYKWHFQETPGETWDYTATQHIMMAELNIEGTERKVLMHAPKNGFFYVIDRTNGKFISGKPFVPVTWAEGLDKDGRPIETAEARYPDPNKPVLTFPSPFGAHNWHPMSYSPNTGLVYFSAQEMPFAYKQDKGFEFKQGEWNLGVQFSVSSLPEDPREAAKIIPLLKGRLLAWDPIKQEKAWSVEHAGPWNGGTLATAGGLVFQGTPGGEFAAYHDETGEKLWSTQVDTGVVAAPMTYMVDGEQYVAVSVGWGTVFGLIVPGEQRSRSRVLVFKVGGTEKLGEHPVVADRRHQWPKREEMPEAAGTPTQVAAGKEIYLSRCVWCHGDASLSAGVLPDLRMLDKAKHANFENVVYEGIYAEKGMPAFKELLSKEDVEAVRQYIVKRAHDTRPADM